MANPEKFLADCYKVINFIKSLDDNGIETYIRVAKESGDKIEDEDKFRETLKYIRDSKE